VPATSDVSPNTSSRLLTLDQVGLECLATSLACAVVGGDWVALYGALGAGKTTFARAFIRSFLEDITVDVPSPTYTLRQDYEGARGRIVHCDFYRIGTASELNELGLDEFGVVWIVEWPQHGACYVGPSCLEVHIEASADPSGRNVTLIGDCRQVTAALDNFFRTAATTPD
jgi:N-acetylmuramate 1-kinase